MAHVHHQPKLVDSSDSLFSMYNERAKEYDEKTAESWKGDAEGILVFVREQKACLSAGY